MQKLLAHWFCLTKFHLKQFGTSKLSKHDTNIGNLGSLHSLYLNQVRCMQKFSKPLDPKQWKQSKQL